MRIIPYLDARFIENDIEKKIIMYRRMGFEGLKLLYIPEEDDLMRTQGMQQAFGRTYKQSEMVTSLLIESAASQGMCVLIHIDLRKYGEFIEEVIKRHPLTNFNIAHFGFSRRAIAPLLEKYDNCYTDFAALIPFMKTDSVSYLDFIKSYLNRILFASDTLIGQTQTVQDTMQFIRGFLKDPGLQERIFRENYLSFHKRSVKT
jgi:predicted TIM-barrel fold metal-dependent hydrolase